MKDQQKALNGAAYKQVNRPVYMPSPTLGIGPAENLAPIPQRYLFEPKKQAVTRPVTNKYQTDEAPHRLYVGEAIYPY